MKDKKIIIYIFTSLLFIITACGKNTGSNNQQNIIEDNTLNNNQNQAQNSDEEEQISDSYEHVLNYDLGTSSLVMENQQTIDYRMQGIIGIPDEQNCPIVIIVHGAHPITDINSDRYDTGFAYLAEALAEAGNLVMSVNVAANYYTFEENEPEGNDRTLQIVAQQLQLLTRAIEGYESGFGVDLTNRGNINEVILIGHSRGGFDVFEISKVLPEVIVKGILSISPIYYKDMEGNLIDIPTSIVIPQYDGDVVNLDGNDFYEMIQQDANRTTGTEIIYLKNANHNGFNTKADPNDLNNTQSDIKSIMDAETQQNFLVQYASDFINKVISSNKTPLEDSTTIPIQLYEYDILARVSSSDFRFLYVAGDPMDIDTDDATVRNVVYSRFSDTNTAGLFQLPGGVAFSGYSLLNIAWERRNAEVDFDVEENLSEYDFLSIDFAIDSTDERNEQTNQSIQITLVDGDDHSQSINIDENQGCMQWQEGTIEENTSENEVNYKYSTFTPLVTYRIPINTLTQINVGNIEEIIISSADNSRGSIMLRSISLEK